MPAAGQPSGSPSGHLPVVGVLGFHSVRCRSVLHLNTKSWSTGEPQRNDSSRGEAALHGLVTGAAGCMHQLVLPLAGSLLPVQELAAFGSVPSV